MSSNFRQFQGADATKAICGVVLALCASVPLLSMSLRLPQDAFARKVLAHTGDVERKPDWALLSILLVCSIAPLGVKLLMKSRILVERLQHEQYKNEVERAIAAIGFQEAALNAEVERLEGEGDYTGAIALLKSGQLPSRPNRPNIAEVRKTESLSGAKAEPAQIASAPETPALKPATKAEPVQALPSGIDLAKKPMSSAEVEADVWDDVKDAPRRKVAKIGDRELSGGLIPPNDPRIIELVEGLEKSCPWVLRLMLTKLLAIGGDQGAGKNTFTDWFATLRVLLLGHEVEVIDPHSNKNTSRPKHFAIYGGKNDWEEIGWRTRERFKRVESTSDALYDATADEYARKGTLIFDEMSSYYTAYKEGQFKESPQIVPIAMTAVRKSDDHWILCLHGLTSKQMGGVEGYSDRVKQGLPLVWLDRTSDEVGSVYPAGTGTLYNIPGIPSGTDIQILGFMRVEKLIETFPELNAVRPKQETPEAIGAEMTKKLAAHKVELGDIDDPLTWQSQEFGDRRFLPTYSGVYAVIDGADDGIKYIGESGNIMRRWVGTEHHRYRYVSEALQLPRIAYYPVDEDTRKIVEGNLIGKYHPPANGTHENYGIENHEI